MKNALLCGIVALGATLGCGSRLGDGEGNVAAVTTQALTSAQARVLGFETPTADWSSSAGVSASNTASSGTRSLAVVPAGWTELISVPLASLGPVKSEFSFDLRAPQAVTWGEARLIVRAPSLGIYWQELGSKSLIGAPVGAFSRIAFSVPAALQTALSGSYSDLEFHVVLNTQTFAAPYLLDNLDVAAAGTPAGTSLGSPSGGASFSITVPKGIAVQNMFLSATDLLQIDDRVTLSQTGRLDTIASLGTAGSQLGAGTTAFGSLISTGHVVLRSHAHLTGFVETGDTVETQDNVQVDGGTTQHANIQAATTTWSVNWPATNQGDVYLAPDTQRTLAPGAYGVFDVQSRSVVHLSTGTYFFTSFNTEPQASILVDALNGPVQLYVQQSFTYKGAITEARGDAGRVFVGYLGTTPAFLQAPFVGGMVAPNAEIQLQRPDSGQHQGAFFGRDVHAYSDSQILHIPIDLSFLCQAGDRDQDGTFDCTDQCPADKSKVKPGLCGCNVPEIDQDHDGIPSCLDGCDSDPNKSSSGTCGCGNAAAALGTACADGICAGTFSCDGHGQCGNPEACSPEPGNCVAKEFKHHVYWFCNGTGGFTQAKAKCEATPGQTLVEIDDEQENEFVSAIAGGKAWIGGSDQALEGTWSWSASSKVFFAGGARQNRSFIAWANGEPSGQTGENCAALDPATQTWSDESCSSSFKYVCEKVQVPNAPPRGTPISCNHFKSAPDCTDSDGSGGSGSGGGGNGACVAQSTAFTDQSGQSLDGPADTDAFDALVNNCKAQCPTGNEPGCATACVGAASIPPAGSECADFSADNKQKCDITSPNLSFECTDVSQCAPGEICTMFYDCDGCDTTNGDVCNKRCVGKMRCGTPLPTCAAPNPHPLCSDVSICSDDSNTVDGNPLDDPSTNVSNTTVHPEDIFTAPKNAEASAYATDPLLDGVGCTGNQASAHPWCHYGLSTVLPPQHVGDQGTPDDKRVQAGAGSVLQFNADPNLDLDFDITPKAFGEFDAHLNASASLLASATVNLLAGHKEFDILEAKAGLSGTRCGAGSTLVLNVLGEDILPALLGDDAAAALRFTIPDADTQTKCNAAIDNLDNAVDRAKKALRDAQDLLRQYHQIATDGNHLDPQKFCQAVTAKAPDNFPFGNCDSELPEQTINRFIEYYGREVFGYNQGDIPIPIGVENALSQLSAFTLQIPTIVIPDTSHDENLKLTSVQFFLGPVPMTLEMEAFASYGINGGFDISISPSIPSDGNPVTLASLRAEANPFANAGVSLFVGAGFSAGPFEAAAGVDGRVTLGQITVPAHAGVSILGSATPDDRDFTVQAPDADGLLFPESGAQRYHFQLGYDYSGRVQISKVLSGSLSASVRVSFAFFSKRWSKELVHFNGLPLDSDPDKPSFFLDKVLFSGEHTTDFAAGDFDWGVSEMPLPFIRLKPLPVPSQAVTQGTVESYQTSCVEKLFYEQQCVCVAEDDQCNPDPNAEPCCPGLLCQPDAIRGGNTCQDSVVK